MADNKIIIGGAILPSTPDTPTDARCRVQTFEDIQNVENPYVGMKVYVVDSGKEYVVRKLMDKEIGSIVITGGAIDPEGVQDAVEELSRKVQADIQKTTRYEYDEEHCALTIL